MSGPALEVSVYDTVESLSSLESEWEQLISEFPAATTFCTLDWLLPWWRAFGNDQQLRVVAFRDRSRLIGLAPLSITPHAALGGIKLKLLRIMGDGSGDSDNLDLPVLPGYEEPFLDAVLDFLDGDKIGWDVAQFNTLPNNSAAGTLLLAHLKERGYVLYTSQRPWLVTHLPAEWEAYLAQLSSENRNNLKRYTRRLGRHYQVEIRKCTKEEELSRGLEDLFELHQKRWQLRGEPGTFASAERRKFYFELSCALLKHGNLEFWMITLNGKTAAAQFCFRHGEGVFLLQEGFDPGHSADRVGFILRGHVLEQLVAAGVRRYDFLYGQSEGKQIWVPQLQHYQDIHFAKRGSRGGLYLQLTNTALEKKEWLRAHLPQSAWSTLKQLNPKKRGARKPEPTGKNSPAENEAAQPAAPEGKGKSKKAAKVAKILLPTPLVREIKRYRKFPSSERPLYTKIRLRDGIGLRPRIQASNLADAHAFVFVCFGNIMRSPMCEALMRRELESRPELRVTVTSAGLNATPGKEAHPWSIASARQFGISLEKHRARLLNQEMISRADIIFAMDYQNQVEFLSRFPADKKKLFMLSDFAPADYRQVEIGDPYYGDEEATRRCYDILQACIRNLVASLVQQTPSSGTDVDPNRAGIERKEQPAAPETARTAVRTTKDE